MLLPRLGGSLWPLLCGCLLILASVQLVSSLPDSSSTSSASSSAFFLPDSSSGIETLSSSSSNSLAESVSSSSSADLPFIPYGSPLPLPTNDSDVVIPVSFPELDDYCFSHSGLFRHSRQSAAGSGSKADPLVVPANSTVFFRITVNSSEDFLRMELANFSLSTGSLSFYGLFNSSLYPIIVNQTADSLGVRFYFPTPKLFADACDPSAPSCSVFVALRVQNDSAPCLSAYSPYASSPCRYDLDMCWGRMLPIDGPPLSGAVQKGQLHRFGMLYSASMSSVPVLVSLLPDQSDSGVDLDLYAVYSERPNRYIHPNARHPNHWENAAEYMYLYAGSPTGLYILYAYAGDSRRQANPYVIWAQSNGKDPYTGNEEGSMIVRVTILICLIFVLGYGGIAFIKQLWRSPRQAGPVEEIRGVNETELKQIPTITFTAGMFPPADCTCAICLEEYVAGRVLRKLNCGHHFHVECLDQWLSSSRLCPRCRQSIDDSHDLRRYSLSQQQGQRRPTNQGQAAGASQILPQPQTNQNSCCCMPTLHRLQSDPHSAGSPAVTNSPRALGRPVPPDPDAISSPEYGESAVVLRDVKMDRHDV